MINFVDIQPTEHRCGNCAKWEGVREPWDNGSYRVLRDSKGDCKKPDGSRTPRTFSSCETWKPIHTSTQN